MHGNSRARGRQLARDVDAGAARGAGDKRDLAVEEPPARQDDFSEKLLDQPGVGAAVHQHVLARHEPRLLRGEESGHSGESPSVPGTRNGTALGAERPSNDRTWVAARV